MCADEYADRYQNASRKQKAIVVRDLVHCWRRKTPSGRFLTRTDPAKGDDSRWHDVGHDAAMKKAAKILSERCSERRAAASQKERPQKRQAEFPNSMPSPPNQWQQAQSPTNQPPYAVSQPSQMQSAQMPHAQMPHAQMPTAQHHNAIHSQVAMSQYASLSMAHTVGQYQLHQQGINERTHSLSAPPATQSSQQGAFEGGRHSKLARYASDPAGLVWPSHPTTGALVAYPPSEQQHQRRAALKEDDSPPYDFDAQQEAFVELAPDTSILPSAAALAQFFTSGNTSREPDKNDSPDSK